MRINKNKEPGMNNCTHILIDDRLLVQISEGEDGGVQ